MNAPDSYTTVHLNYCGIIFYAALALAIFVPIGLFGALVLVGLFGMPKVPVAIACFIVGALIDVPAVLILGGLAGQTILRRVLWTKVG